MVMAIVTCFNQVGNLWYVAFGSPSGLGTPFSSGISTPAYVLGKGYLLAGDLTGAGKDGLLVNNGGTWWYYTWNGSSFSGVSTGVAYDTTAGGFALADTNGDGRPDLVSVIFNPGGVGKTVVYITLNNSSGGTVSFGAAIWRIQTPPRMALRKAVRWSALTCSGVVPYARSILMVTVARTSCSGSPIRMFRITLSSSG